MTSILLVFCIDFEPRPGLNERVVMHADGTEVILPVQAESICFYILNGTGSYMNIKRT